MRNRTRGVCAMSLGAALALAAGGCGKLSAGGEGSETHWLLKCDADADCDVGQCLCGVCTLSCASLRDCPAPLDECSNSGGACESAVCGSSVADSSSQALAVADPYTTNRYPTCDGGRQVALTNIDVGFRKEDGAGPPFEPATRVIPDYPSGFLFFGGPAKRFYRVGGNGELVRDLPLPVVGGPDLQFDDAVALEDGTLLLGGHDGDKAWVGKVDASWNAVWGRVLDTPVAIQTQIAPLPDGGVAVLVFTGTRRFDNDPDASEATDVHWARLSSNGETLWQNEAAIGSLSRVFPRALATTTDRIAIALHQRDGYSLEVNDLDGNVLVQVDAPQSALLRAIRALPAGQLTILASDRLVLSDWNGNPAWSYSLSDEQASGDDVAFDPVRNELLVVGTNTIAHGSFMGAVDMAGAPVWSMRREQWPVGPVDSSDSNVYGYSLESVAVDAAGNAVATRAISSQWLSMTWVGAKACGG